jgi:hypothetical protein
VPNPELVTVFRAPGGRCPESSRVAVFRAPGERCPEFSRVVVFRAPGGRCPEFSRVACALPCEIIHDERFVDLVVVWDAIVSARACCVLCIWCLMV